MTSPDTTTESKDRFFEEIAALAERMIAEHGREFTMGAFVLAARFIAEKKDLGKRGLETTN